MGCEENSNHENYCKHCATCHDCVEEFMSVKNSGWISVDDRLPSQGFCVDVWLSHSDYEGRICKCFYDEDEKECWYWDDKVEARIRFNASLVTHWMPLPDPINPGKGRGHRYSLREITQWIDKQRNQAA